ncbi:Thioredoxin-related transmembrane protein 2-like protein [Drosera capensis]
MIRNRLQWMNTMVTEPYYFFHFLAFFSYVPIRLSAAALVDLRLLRREVQAVLAFLVIAAVKMVREETWEGFIADILFFAKVFLLVLALFLDYHLALWYVMVFLGDSNALTPLQLETTLVEGETSRFWLVEFRALYASPCVRASRILPELSITYSNKDLSFGIVDLGLFPNAAARFGISLAGGMGLPTYILFDGNAEVARFPELELGGKGSRPSKKLLAQVFELDRRLIDYVNSK